METRISSLKIFSLFLLSSAGGCAELDLKNNENTVQLSLTQGQAQNSGESKDIDGKGPQQNSSDLGMKQTGSLEDARHSEDQSKQNSPKINAFELAHGAKDGSLNLSEASTEVGAVLLNASFFKTAHFAITDPDMSCNDAQNYSEIEPLLNSQEFIDGQVKKVCVKLISSTGEIIFGSTSPLTVDKSMPELSVSSPANWNSTSESFVIHGKCESGLEVSISSKSLQNSSSKTKCSESGTFSISLPILGAENSLVLTLSSQDKAGNISTSTLSTQWNQSLPLISISGPSQSVIGRAQTAHFKVTYLSMKAPTGTSPTVSMAGDSSGCVATTSNTNEANVKNISITGCSAETGRLTFNLTEEPDSEMGGTATSVVIPGSSVEIDNRAPSVKVTAPSADFAFSTTEPNTALSGTCESNLLVKLDGDIDGLLETNCDKDGTFKFDRWTLTSGYGAKSVFVSQTDLAGNTGKSATLRVQLLRPASAPTLTIPNQAVASLKAKITGTCDTTASTHNATTTVGVVQSAVCDAQGKFTVLIHLPSGPEATFRVTVSSSRNGAQPSSSSYDVIRKAFVCPAGFIGVPSSGIEKLGHAQIPETTPWYLDINRDFCVMKYPAKRPSTAANFAIATDLTASPWTFISLANSGGNAASACSNISGGTYRLLHNTQWQTIARNAENVSANWSSGVVGTGTMARGHTDGVPNSALAHSADSDPYFGTENTAGFGWDQRRTKTLSNGEVIWDLGGNIWHILMDRISEYNTLPGLGINPTPAANIWSEFAAAVFPLNSTNRLLFGPMADYNSGFGVGRLHGGPTDSVGPVFRGGSWKDGSNAGAFATDLSRSSTYQNNDAGFRCVFIPPSI